MPRPTCESCCNPSELSRSIPTYRQAILNILCSLVNTTTLTLCDAVGAVVVVRYSSSPVTGVPDFANATAYYLDGTEYTDPIADLVVCGTGGT